MGETSAGDLNNIRWVSRVTVIVPATNEPPTLGDCLRAIEGCDDPPEEVIVVREPTNAGPAAARNLGAQSAAGDLLVFVDADVVVHEDAIRRIRRAVRRQRGRRRRLRLLRRCAGGVEPRVVVPQPASSPRPPGLRRRRLDLLGRPGSRACRGVSRCRRIRRSALRCPEHRGHRAGVASHGDRTADRPRPRDPRDASEGVDVPADGEHGLRSARRAVGSPPPRTWTLDDAQPRLAPPDQHARCCRGTGSPSSCVDRA